MMREIRNVQQRIMMAIARGVVRAISDAGSRQTVQVELLKDELRDGLERMQNYGMTSHPHPGADAAVVFLGGNREQGIVLAMENRQFRVVGLQQGEVCIYDDLGNRVTLLRDMVKIEAVQHLEAIAPTMKIVSAVTIEGSLKVDGPTDLTGAVSTTGTITNNGKNIGASHTHPVSGSSTGGVN
jgi:phage baseplate assembly protein V